MIAGLAFAMPLLLSALIALPVLWWILRAVPPAPIRRRFPGVALLLGLKDDDSQTDKTPWWLLVLRMAAAHLGGLCGPRHIYSSRRQSAPANDTARGPRRAGRTHVCEHTCVRVRTRVRV